MRRLILILLLFVLSALLWWVYDVNRLPPGVEPKGESSELVAWLSLIGSIVSLITGLVGLTLQLIKLKQASNKSRTIEDS
jgi:hypothetical protein